MAPWSARLLVVLLGVTVIPRVLLAVQLGVVGEPERWEYDVIAANIVEGRGHVYDRDGFLYAAYSPPLWSYTLAALLRLPGNTRVSVQILQGLLCFVSAVIFGGLARRITGEDRVGILTGLLVALQPSLLYYSVVKSDPLPLNVLLLGLIATSAAGLVTRPGIGLAVMFGGLVALGLLSRGTPIVALPVVFLGLAIRWGRDARRPIALASLSFVLCVLPWVARNVAVVGQPLITSTAGENLWWGNHEGAGGAPNPEGGRNAWITPTNPELPARIRQALANGAEADRHEVFRSEAWRFMRTHPAGAMALFARKMRAFWWRIDSDPRDYSAAVSIAYELIYRLELAFALFGGWLLFATRSRVTPARNIVAAGLAVGLVFAISLLQSAFYVQGRHRFMIEPVLLIFTALGTTEPWRRLARPRRDKERTQA